MTFMQYASAHPWWTLLYVLLSMGFVLGVIELLVRWKPINISYDYSRSDRQSHSHNHNWPHGTTAKVNQDKFTVQLPTHPPGCCRHPRRDCATNANDTSQERKVSDA